MNQLKTLTAFLWCIEKAFSLPVLADGSLNSFADLDDSIPFAEDPLEIDGILIRFIFSALASALLYITTMEKRQE